MHLIFTTSGGEFYYYSHFTDEKAEAHGGYVTHSSLYLHPGLSVSITLIPNTRLQDTSTVYCNLHFSKWKLGGGTKVAGKMKSHIKRQMKEMEEIRCLQETIVNGK